MTWLELILEPIWWAIRDSPDIPVVLLFDTIILLLIFGARIAGAKPLGKLWGPLIIASLHLVVGGLAWTFHDRSVYYGITAILWGALLLYTFVINLKEKRASTVREHMDALTNGDEERVAEREEEMAYQLPPTRGETSEDSQEKRNDGQDKEDLGGQERTRRRRRG